MERILCIGDPHFRVDNAEATTQLSELIYNIAPDYDSIVILGDIMDTHEKADVRPLKRVGEFLLRLSKIKPTYCLVGNHDRINDNDFLSGIHSLVQLEIASVHNLHIVSNVLRMGDYVYVPYVPKNRFKEALDLAKYPDGTPASWRDARVVFAHQEINGAKLGVQVSSIEEKWEAELPIVFSGHIHDYQVVTSNWIYPGTPFPHAFGDTDRKAVIAIEVGTDITYNRLTLNLPTKRLEHLTADTVRSRLDVAWEPAVNTKYKWVIKGNRVELKALNKDKRLAMLLNHVICHYEYTDVLQTLPQRSTVVKSYLSILREKVNTGLPAQYLEYLLATH